LNKTCEAYSTSVILIPGKNDYKSDYLDLNLKSTINAKENAKNTLFIGIILLKNKWNEGFKYNCKFKK